MIKKWMDNPLQQPVCQAPDNYTFVNLAVKGLFVNTLFTGMTSCAT
jgi:hypothetical protein